MFTFETSRPERSAAFPYRPVQRQDRDRALGRIGSHRPRSIDRGEQVERPGGLDHHHHSGASPSRPMLCGPRLAFALSRKISAERQTSVDSVPAKPARLDPVETIASSGQNNPAFQSIDEISGIAIIETLRARALNRAWPSRRSGEFRRAAAAPCGRDPRCCGRRACAWPRRDGFRRSSG